MLITYCSYNSQTNHIVHDPFLCLWQPYSIQTTLDKKLETQFVDYISDISLTLNEGQGHQT